MNGFQFPKDHCSLEGSQASSFSPTGKIKIKKMSMERFWDYTDSRITDIEVKTLPTATSSTINLTWNYLRINPDLRGEGPATSAMNIKTHIILNYNYNYNTFRTAQ